MRTPGPWRYEASTKTIRAVPSNYWLATMDSWDGAVDHEANAKLIAAAPDLLAACEDVLHQLSTDSDLETITGAAKYERLTARLREAIKAAE